MIKRLLFCFLLQGVLFGQSEPAPDAGTWELATYDLGHILGGMGYAYTRPLEWQGAQWATFGGVMAVTGAAYLADDPVSDFFVGNREDVPPFLRDFGSPYGGPVTNYVLTGSVYLTGLFTKNARLRRTGVLLVSSASTAALVQLFLKGAVGRARPLTGESKDTFKPFWRGDGDYHAFPSGHAVMAFTNAWAIAKQFRSPWVKAGIYTVGLVPGISRLWEGKHWLSDVVFSWALAIFTVESIDRYLDTKYREKYNQEEKTVSWNLQFGPGTIGVVLEF